jgi:hypothetical protein
MGVFPGEACGGSSLPAAVARSCCRQEHSGEKLKKKKKRFENLEAQEFVL